MADFSSYIMIDVSGCASALTHTDDGLDHGYWAKGPPASIGAGVVLGPSDPLNANKGEWPIQAEDNPGPRDRRAGFPLRRTTTAPSPSGSPIRTRPITITPGSPSTETLEIDTR